MQNALQERDLSLGLPQCPAGEMDRHLEFPTVHCRRDGFEPGVQDSIGCSVCGERVGICVLAPPNSR